MSEWYMIQYSQLDDEIKPQPPKLFAKTMVYTIHCLLYFYNDVQMLYFATHQR